MRALHAALIRGSKAPIGALPPRQIPIVAGGEGTAFSLDALEASRWQGENGAGAAESGVASVGVGGGGGGGGRCARGRRQLTREAIAADAALLAEVRRREAVDLALYAFARRLAAEKAEAEGAETAAAAGSAQAAVTAAETAREWADDFPERVRRLQAAQPPQHRLPLVFTHIPKCAGSTFRNQLLLEYARRYRRPDDVACVLYRDVHFREHAVSGAARPFNASAPGLARHGPECLDAAGYLRDTTLILTGHVAFHPLVLSRLRAPSLAAVVILREPFARLVSLFNMYPDGTFGTAPRNASAAERFAAAYRRRFAGRNALTCFTAGLSLCDSVGALTKAAVGAASLRRARFNLVERYDVVGLTEHSERSMAIVAWAFGWLPSLLRDGGLLSAKGGFSGVRRVTPGSEHRRLALDDLCGVPGLVRLMEREEAPDRLLYRFATSLYQQRLQHVPADVLALAPEGAGVAPLVCSTDPLDVAVAPSGAGAGDVAATAMGSRGRLEGASDEDLRVQP